jgi:hypothetical protein
MKRQYKLMRYGQINNRLPSEPGIRKKEDRDLRRENMKYERVKELGRKELSRLSGVKQSTFVDKSQ